MMETTTKGNQNDGRASNNRDNVDERVRRQGVEGYDYERCWTIVTSWIKRTTSRVIEAMKMSVVSGIE